MKKFASLIACLLLFSLVFSLASCMTPPPGSTPTDPIRIGVMSGPTGMGMAKMMHDQAQPDAKAKYVFEVYTTPQSAIADLAAGELHAVCLPTNTAAAQANAAEDYISVLATNCLGSLYLLSNDNADINTLSDLEGKTIYVSVPGSTTKPILEYLLAEAGVTATIEVEVDHPTLVTRMAEGATDRADIVVLPEPYVSKALIEHPDYAVDLNLSTEWSALSENELVMGCLVMRNGFLKSHDAQVQELLKDYKASIEYIADPDNRENAAQMIVDAGILGAKPLAIKALTNLDGSIVYMDGDGMKEALISFYDAIGLVKPTDDFYYAGIKEN